jgi:hypothetical protein
MKREQMELVDAARGLYHWSAQVQPGLYFVSFAAVPYALLVDVDRQGKRDCSIEVPPPCRVRVRCVQESGDDVEVESIHWFSRMPSGFMSTPETVVMDPFAHRLEFRAPQGEVVISGEGTESASIQAGPGINDAVLRIQTSGLQPFLMDEGTHVPWDKDRLPTLVPAEGQQGTTNVSWSGDLLVLRRRQPGLYWLRLPPFFDYEPIADQPVQLEKGSVKPLVIELQHKP